MEKAEKISVNDLSVGDLVCAEQLCGVHSEPRLTPPMKVVGLGESWVNLEIDPEQGGPFEYEPSEIRGVPITAEVLEKNGFTHDKWSKKIWRYEDEESEGVYYIESSRLEITNDVCKMYITCKSVAELQHALRLAKVGKEITL